MPEVTWPFATCCAAAGQPTGLDYFSPGAHFVTVDHGAQDPAEIQARIIRIVLGQ